MFHLPYAFQDIPDDSLDLCMNVSSFDEMLPEQVMSYLELIDRKCSGWLYLKGYASRSGQDSRRPWGLRQFPYPSRWRLAFERMDTVSPNFIERIFDLRTRPTAIPTQP
jgi:hypothetical protein